MFHETNVNQPSSGFAAASTANAAVSINPATIFFIFIFILPWILS